MATAAKRDKLGARVALALLVVTLTIALIFYIGRAVGNLVVASDGVRTVDVVLRANELTPMHV